MTNNIYVYLFSDNNKHLVNKKQKCMVIMIFKIIKIKHNLSSPKLYYSLNFYLIL